MATRNNLVVTHPELFWLILKVQERGAFLLEEHETNPIWVIKLEY